jgi:hypothetical protein
MPKVSPGYIPPEEGKKFDKDKLDWSVLDLAFIEPLIPVFKLGEHRYGYLNHLNPFENSSRRFYAAIMRHMRASQYDPLAINEEDGGVYHLAQIAWDALQRLSQALKEKEKQNGTVVDQA